MNNFNDTIVLCVLQMLLNGEIFICTMMLHICCLFPGSVLMCFCVQTSGKMGVNC